MLKRKRQPTDDDLLNLWLWGQDTATIARYFRCGEAGVANRLAKLLDRYARQTALAA